MRPRTSVHVSAPSRSSLRARSAADLVHTVLRRLSPRDWQIIRYLHAHRVLTTQHITDALFPSTRAAEMRLLNLYQLRVVDRFRPFAHSGSAPYHWILDEIGAQLIAWDRGEDMKQLGWRRERALGIAASRQLDHRLGVNGFFCALLRAARQMPECRLTEWRSHPKVSGLSCFVEPDGYAVWEEAGCRLPFYLEYDCGTERLDRLAEKLKRYRETVPELDRKYCERWGDPYANLVLFVFPGALREMNARRVLQDSQPVRVATAIEASGWRRVTPAAAIWAPVGGAVSGMRRMIELDDLWRSRGATAATAAADDGEPWDGAEADKDARQRRGLSHRR